MTTINWERTSGELVEEFVAAHLLLRSGIGNLIRPSQGDGGIDVQIPTPEGWEIYQIKRFATNLDSSQKRQIKKSWSRFQSSNPSYKAFKFWALVLPLDPTPQNLSWFEKLTSESGHETRWIGRATLDGWAAKNPKLTDYFFGDGNRRTLELLASTVSAVNPPDAKGGEALLASVGTRLASLGNLLDEVDPFYRYELEFKRSSIDQPPTADLVTDAVPSNRVMTTIQEIDGQQCLYTHIIARSAMSTVLRPVIGSFHMSASTPEEVKALELWTHYGAPLKAASGRVVSSEGPPGTTSASGTELTAWTFSPVDAEPLPPLEVRLFTPDGELLTVVAATKSEHSSGLVGDGRWIQVELGPAVTIQFFTGAAGRADSFSLTINAAVGSEPAKALQGVELVAAMQGNRVELAVQDGPTFAPSSLASFDNERVFQLAAARAHEFRVLTTIQKYTLSRVTIPDDADITPMTRAMLIWMADVLARGTVEMKLTEFPVTESPAFETLGDAPSPFSFQWPVVFQIGSQKWDTEMVIRRDFESVFLDRSVSPAMVRPGESDRVYDRAVPGRLEVRGDE